MRKAALSFVAVAVLFLIFVWYPQYVQKPVKDGPGPLSVYVDPSLPVPEFHTTIEWWRTNHMDILNRGDSLQSDCLQCHDPVTSCNNCHSYVGAAEIVP